jgi:hypothetical protein
MLKTLLNKNFDGKKNEMMITYDMHPHSKTLIILKLWYLKYNFRMFNFEESFANVNGS